MLLRVRRDRLIALTLIAGALVHNLALGWHKWGDLLIDCGKEWDVAARVGRGETLYASIRYYYGPLAPRLNGFLFSIFGEHTDVLAIAGVVSALLMSVVIYSLARWFVDRVAAALIVVAFMYLCAFAQLWPNGICNFVQPYGFAATYGILLASGSVLLLMKWARSPSPGFIWSSALLLALVALTKMEVFFALAVTHAAFLVLCAWSDRVRLGRHVVGAYTLSVAVTLAGYGYFVVQAGADAVKDSLFGLISPEFAPFSRRMMGTFSLATSLPELAYSCGAFLAALTVGAAVAFGTRNIAQGHTRKLTALFLSALTAGALYFFFPMGLAFRMVPVLLGAILIVYAVRWLKASEQRRRLLPQIVFFVFALACLPRILLNVGTYGYGFFLVPPALVAVAVFTLRLLPGWMPGLHLSRAARGIAFGMLLILIGIHVDISSRNFGARRDFIDAPRGRMYVLSNVGEIPAGECYRALVNFLTALPKDTRVLVLPQGSGFTFISGLDTPYKMHAYMDYELTGAFTEDRVLADWSQDPPEWIVRTQHNPDPLLGGFGSRYALKIASWIVDSYEPFATIGSDSFIMVLRRKQNPPQLPAAYQPQPSP